MAPVGDIFGDQLQYHFPGFVSATGGAATEPDDDDATVLAFPLHFDASQTSGVSIVLGQPVQLPGIDEDVIPHIQLEKIFDRTMAEQGNERRIYVEEPSAERAAANAKGCAQDQRAGAGFGAAKRFFIALVLDGGGQLLRNKFQNLAIAFSEAGVFVVALDDKRSNAGRAALQGNAQPVQ